ncbi:MAG TPA: helix-turn-helix transcriptional regulator [Spirochaetia bacterium]
MEFWAHVEQILRASGRTKAWLARATGVSINTLNGWAHKGRAPRIDEALRIARALGTTIENLEQGIVGPPPSTRPDVRAVKELCALLESLSRDELIEMRGVMRSYADLHFRKPPQRASRRPQ